MKKKKTHSRLSIGDDSPNENCRVGHGRSRGESRYRPTTQQTLERAERRTTGQDEAPRRDGPSGAHCTAPSVNAEAVVAPPRLFQSQGRPLGGLPGDKEPLKEQLKVCQFYMRTGTCGYGDGCRHIHPPNVYPPQLSALGYPLREGVERCPFYMKNGCCGYGATCRFNHPMPTPQRTSQRMIPHGFWPTLNGGAPFSEPMYFPQMSASPWFGPVLPPMTYAEFMARHQSFPFAATYHQFPYEYPPFQVPVADGWAQHKYMIGSPPSGLPGPTNSEDTSELHEDLSKFESEEDSDSGHIDRCWSN